MSATVACAQPGCSGNIEDGYCNNCGLAPNPATLMASASSAASSTSAASASPVASSPSNRSTPTTGTGGAARSTATRRTGTTRTSSSRNRIGAGLVTVPEIAVPDPLSVVMVNPEVGESKRFCANCGEPVGRSRSGHPGRLEGFCGKCRHRFSFAPKLERGEVVAGQYETVGCVAHGGLGWIYLARDQHVSNRWVVLKGLLDSGDTDAMSAALAEARFLAAVEHPNIVKIYNFVQQGDAGYTVMEYVGGSSLKSILAERRAANSGRPDPLPVAQAIAYVLEILPAFGYLHRQGLVFCDFKPDNVILQGESLKLIDLGGVRLIDDPEGAIYGTVGFQAPEIADVGPSIPSDLYTVARTLAVLALDFKGYQSTYKASLPPVEEAGLLATHDSLRLWLEKGTATHPAHRFQSADEMADQLLGVLREIVAREGGSVKPAASTWFSGDTFAAVASMEDPDWFMLPALKADPNDTAAALLATLPDEAPAGLARLLSEAPMQTVEVKLRTARAQIEAGLANNAGKTLDAIEREDPWEWRVAWYRGLLAMEATDLAAAGQEFDRVYREVPGELAPKLALGLVAEAAGDPANAARYFDVVSRTDPGYTTATYGLARSLAAMGDRKSAVEAYARVPQASSAYVDAQLRAARILVAHSAGAPPGASELARASATVNRLTLDAEQRARTASQLLEAALELVQAGTVAPANNVEIMGSPLEVQGLRVGLERAYRDLARLAVTSDERIRLVDRANQVRPKTLV